MKKDYMDPELDIVLFAEADIIATSTQIGEGDDTFANGDEKGTF